MKSPAKVIPALVCIFKSSVSASPLTSLIDAGNSVVDLTRRSVNLSNLFGSPTTAEAYEQILSQPVFSVTTPWGSPYLLFDKASDSESLTFDNTGLNDNGEDIVAEENLEKNQQVGLYFLDQEDAMRFRDEMMQMEQMAGADMRVTVSSLGKAMSHAVNLNGGLPTGQPVEPMTGKLKSPSDGGSLRYKIVPAKRELFYATRCEGRERVGFFGLNAADDAEMMIRPMHIGGAKLLSMKKSAAEINKKRRVIGEEDTEDAIRKEYAHMEGSVGIPVFHCEELRRYSNFKQGILKQNQTPETPLFFSYDDLLESWEVVRDRLKDKAIKSKENDKTVVMPEKPTVEVYNLVDVVTSIDRKKWQANRSSVVRRNQLLGKIPIINKYFGSGESSSEQIDKLSSGLEQIVFIPSSRTAKFKERVTKVGNSKVRSLRPMRPWGRNAM